MKRIGLLSDTHAHFDNKMSVFLSSVDEIWHAGDIGDVKVLDKLNKIAPVKAVYGNIDNNIIRQELGEDLITSIENVPVFMTHIGGYPNRYAPGVKSKLEEHKTKLFISGHSHILKIMHDKALNCLHINPGAAGIRGIHTVRTMVRFSVSGIDIHDLEVWEHQR